MSEYISLSEAFERWQELAADIPADDGPALAESWNDYTDMLHKNGELCALQYQFAPAYDEEMPGPGSHFDPLKDDREFILERLGVTMSAKFVPFSRSRNKAEKNLSVNWEITLKRGGREIITTDYMQGIAHVPEYTDPQYGRPGFMSIARHDAIRKACERGRRVNPPSISDVFYCLLMDAGAIDYRDFSEWAEEYGYDSDSIKARETYDACIATALAFRSAFGEKLLCELRELFADM